MSTSNICILISITVYLVFVVLIGFKYSKESNSVDEYYLGGRKLGPLVTAMSAEASDMSSWLLMGLPGLAYATGIASPSTPSASFSRLRWLGPCGTAWPCIISIFSSFCFGSTY